MKSEEISQFMLLKYDGKKFVCLKYRENTTFHACIAGGKQYFTAGLQHRYFFAISSLLCTLFRDEWLTVQT